MVIISLDQIKQILPKLDLIAEIQQGFQAYSEGRAIVLPVGEMILERGEVHIKYGFLKHDDHYVIKVLNNA